MFGKWMILPLVGGLLIAAAPASATAVLIVSNKDTTLYESATGDVSNGAGGLMTAGRTNQQSNSKRRALIAFNVAAAVPAGATITSAAITLLMTQSSGGAQSVDLRKVTSAWGEGTSDASASPGSGVAATTGDATWIYNNYNTTQWVTAGGDFSATASASTSVNGVGAYIWASAQLVSDVQNMLNSPGTNNGWLVLGNEAASQTAKQFATRENTTVASRPVLSVTYSAAAVNEWQVY